MKRSMQKIVFGLALGAMLMPSFYAFAKTEMANTAGQWRMEEKYWTFLNEHGEKLKGWIVSNGEWYFLDENGNLKTGWHEEKGKWYFFNTEMGAKIGSLLTGWHWVEGYCYYFAETDNSTYGTLFVNGTTPDGYRVNHSGQWVNENGEAYYIGGKGISSTHVAGASRPIPGEAASSGTVSGTGRGPVASSGGSSFGTAFSGKAGANVGGSVSKPESDEKKPVVEERKEDEKKPVVEEKKEDEKKPATEEKKEEDKKEQEVADKDKEENPETPKNEEEAEKLEAPKGLSLTHHKTEPNQDGEYIDLYYLAFGNDKNSEAIVNYISAVQYLEVNGEKYTEVEEDWPESFTLKNKLFSKIATGNASGTYKRVVDGKEITQVMTNALVITRDAFQKNNEIVIYAEGYKKNQITLSAKMKN